MRQGEEVGQMKQVCPICNGTTRHLKIVEHGLARTDPCERCNEAGFIEVEPDEDKPSGDNG